MKALRRLAAQLRWSGHDVISKSGTTSATAAAEVLDKHVKPFEEIPGPSGLCNLPLIGPLFHFKPFTTFGMPRLNDMMDHFHDTYGPVVKVNMGRWIVYVEEPHDIETVFRNEGRLPKRPLPEIHLQYSKDKGINAGLGGLEGEEWYSLRRAVNAKLMMPSSPLHYLQAQNKVADDLIRKITENNLNAEELQAEFFKYAAESIGVVTFNTRLGLLDDDFDQDPNKAHIFDTMRTFFALFSKFFHSPPLIMGLFKSQYYKQYATCFEAIQSHIAICLKDAFETIEQMEKEGKLNPDEPNLLLSLLSAGHFSLDEIKMISLDLFVAGTESTAQNMQLFLYNLATHPEKQEKLHKELQTVVGDQGDLKAEHMNKLVYLKACLRESFRYIYPTMSGTGRFIPKDLVVGGYHVPAGTLVVMNNQRAVKNSRYFSQPYEFIPERWLRDEKGNRPCALPPMAHLPFGFGPRNCAGRRFAEQEIYLAAAKLLLKFKIGLEPGKDNLFVEYYTFASPRDPIEFQFTRR